MEAMAHRNRWFTVYLLLIAWWFSMAMLNNQRVTWHQITQINPWFPGLEKQFIWNDPMNKQQAVKPPTSWRCSRILPFGMFFVLRRKPDSHGRFGRNRTSQFLSESISEHNQNGEWNLRLPMKWWRAQLTPQTNWHNHTVSEKTYRPAARLHCWTSAKSLETTNQLFFGKTRATN